MQKDRNNGIKNFFIFYILTELQYKLKFKFIHIIFEGKLTFKLKRNYLRYIAGYCAFTRSIIINHSQNIANKAYFLFRLTFDFPLAFFFFFLPIFTRTSIKTASTAPVSAPPVSTSQSLISAALPGTNI